MLTTSLRPAPIHQKASVALWLCVGRYWHGSTAKTKELARERVRSHPGHAHDKYVLCFSKQPRKAHHTGSRSAQRVGRLSPQRDRFKGGAGSRNQAPQTLPPTLGFSGDRSQVRKKWEHENYPRSDRAAASSRGNKGGTLAGYFRKRERLEDLSGGRN